MEHLSNVGFENEKLSKDRVEEILALSEIDVTGYLDYAELVHLMMGDTRNAPEALL